MSNPAISISSPLPFGGLRENTGRIAPGVLLAAGIAGAAFFLRLLPGLAVFSAMIIATLLGMIVRNVAGTPAWAQPGVTFGVKKILRFAIILLGFQLMVPQIVEVGLAGVAIIMATLVTTFVFTKWLGRVMGVDARLAELIGAGTSICGASAVIATNTVTRGRDEDVAYAVATVTVFGSLSMFVYPLLPHLLALGPRAFGLWSGASIHEIAQVVASSFQDGAVAGRFATVAKLTRVMMLAPFVMALGVMASRRSVAVGDGAPHAAPPMPWFVLGFVALVLVNSVVTVPPVTKGWIVFATTFLLSLALAAMGLETDFRKLRAKGLKPLGLAAAAWIFISVFSLVLVQISAYA
ncbi:MAG TPA: YeiH family protein [Rhizomicrobium sp.]|jgi:uncharacterized integral membrane protein (TIGR00698 family)